MGRWWIASISFAVGLAVGAALTSSGRAPDGRTELGPVDAPAAEARTNPGPPPSTRRPNQPLPRESPSRDAAPPEIHATPVTAADTTSLDDLRGRSLVVPVRGISRDELRPTFHDRRGGTREHEALDIIAPRHAPVVAVEDGTIAKLFLSKAGGLTVYQFDPTNTYAYYYAHLERYEPSLKEGLQVRRGQPLGEVGTSGNAPPDTPHLHFAIFRLTKEKHWWQGDPIDPYEVWRK